MRHGSHDDPVMPKGARRRNKVRLKRQPMTLADPTDERHVWLRPPTRRELDSR